MARARILQFLDLTRAFTDRFENKYSPSGLAYYAEFTSVAPTDRSDNKLSGDYSGGEVLSSQLIGDYNSYTAMNCNRIASRNASVDDPSGLLDGSSLPSGGTPTSETDLPFSISMWVKFDDVTDGSQIPFGKSGDGSGFFLCLMDPDLGATEFQLRGPTSSDDATVQVTGGPPPFEDDIWYHLTFTYDGRGGSDAAFGMKIYIDGESQPLNTLSSSGTYVGLKPDTGEPFFIGASGDGTDEVNGEISQFAFWGRELSQEDVSAIYNGTLDEFTYKPLQSGYVSNPYKVVLNERDCATGSYPTILRTTGRTTTLGNTPSAYDDTRAIVYSDANDVHYPAVLQTVDNNKYIRDWVVTPNTTGSIVTTGSVRPFVSDQGLKFSIDQRGVGSPRHDFEPFNESRVYLEDTPFYLVGTSPSVYPGFSSPLDDKIQIVIPVDSITPTTASRFNWRDMTGDFGQERLPGGSTPTGATEDEWSSLKWNRYHGIGTEFSASYNTGFKYYNPGLKMWQDYGFQHAPGLVILGGDDREFTPGGNHLANAESTGIGTWYSSFYHGINNTAAPAIDETPSFGGQWYPTWEKDFGREFGGTAPASRRLLPNGFKQYQFCMSQHTAFMATDRSELLSMGYDKIGAPTMSGMAPFGPTYHATSSNVFNMSNYISHPFALEKIVLNIPIRVRRKNGNLYENRPIGGHDTDSVVDSAIRDIDNYVFFLYRQSHGPSSIIDSKDDFHTSQRYLIASGCVACWNPQVVNESLRNDINQNGLPHNPAVTIKLRRNDDGGIGNKALPISGSDGEAPGGEGSFTGSIRIEMTPAVPSSQFLGGSRFPHRNYNTTRPSMDEQDLSTGVRYYATGCFEPSSVGTIVVQDFWSGGTTFPSRSFSSYSGSINMRGLGFFAQKEGPDQGFPGRLPLGMNFNGVIFDSTLDNGEAGTSPSIQMMGGGRSNILQSNYPIVRFNRSYFGGDVTKGGSAPYSGFAVERGDRCFRPITETTVPRDPIGPIGKAGIPADARPFKNNSGLGTSRESMTLDSSGSYTQLSTAPEMRAWSVPNQGDEGNTFDPPVNFGYTYTLGNDSTVTHEYLNLPIVFGNLPVSTPSPYVLLPGDELILGLDAGISAVPCSGTDGMMFNPVVRSPGGLPMSGSTSEISGSFLIFETGTATLTLFGSMVKNNKEKLFELNQNLTSDAIHEALHFDNPVVDQYSVANRGEIAGSYTSDFVLGDIRGILPYTRFKDSGSQERQLVQSGGIARGKVADFALGSHAIRNVIAVDKDIHSSSYGCLNIFATSPSLGGFNSPQVDPKTTAGNWLLYYTFPLSSSAPSDPNGGRGWNTRMLKTSMQGPLLRSVQLTDFAERYFDTLMPDISDWSLRSNVNVFIESGSLILQDHLNGPSGSILVESASALHDDPSSMYRSNKGGWPYYHTRRARQVYQNFKIEMRAPDVETLSVTYIAGTKFYINNSQTLPAACGDSFGPARSRVHGYRIDDGGNTPLTDSDKKSYWENFRKILDTKSDPVACYDLLFKKGYDFYFRKMKEIAHVVTTTGDESGVAAGSDLYVSASDVIRVFYCKGPGAAHGFAYGIQNTRPQFTRAVYRSNRYGQFRDMLEQRRDGKFFTSTLGSRPTNKGTSDEKGIFGFGEESGVVECFFVNSNNGIELVNPYFTDSSNMDSEATSSCPYRDGKALNRDNLDDIQFLILNEREVFTAVPPSYGGGGGGGCVIEGTLINTDRGEILVENVTTCDKVLSYDFKRSEPGYFDVLLALKSSSDSWYRIRTSCGFELGCSPDHPIMSRERDDCELIASEAKVGDHVWIARDGSIADDKIVSIEIIEEHVNVYNFTINETHTYFSNGILSHNVSTGPALAGAYTAPAGDFAYTKGGGGGYGSGYAYGYAGGSAGYQDHVSDAGFAGETLSDDDWRIF